MVKAGAGGEVSGLMVRTALDSLRRRRIDPKPLLDGLPIPPAPGRERYPWDAFAVLVERQAEALGGPWRLAAVLRDEVEIDPRLRAIAGLFVAPSLLYLHLAPRMASRMFWSLGSRIDVLPEGRIRWEIRIPERCRPAPSFFIGSTGTAEGLPRLVGRSWGRVEAELGDRHAVYLIRPPPSGAVARTIAAVLSRPVADPEVLADAVEMGLDLRFVTEAAGGIGRALLAATDEEGVLATLADRVRERFLCRYLALVSATGGRRILLGEEGCPGARLVRELRIGDRLLGRLEMERPENGEAEAVFDALVPWVALALDRLAGGSEAPLAGRLAAASEAWGLSPRQVQVLEGIVSGRSNKEIASLVGIAVKTVELHVGKLLEKTGCDGRTALVARFYRDLVAR